MSNHVHRPDRRRDHLVATHTGISMLGTAVLMPRSPRHNRALAECLLRMPTGRIT
jgi:hypothetical protein